MIGEQPSSGIKKLFKTVAIYGPLSIFAVLTLVPFAYLICSAFKTQESFFSSSFLPMKQDGFGVDFDGLTAKNFLKLFDPQQVGFGRPLLNSIFYASTSAVIATLFSAMGGFALAKYRFPGRGLVTNLVMVCLIVPGALLLAPSYQVLFQLHLLDSYAGLILPVAAPAFGVYLFRQAFISSLPDEMLEAGRMDGCSEFRLFFQLGLPMVRPMVGAFMLITYLAAWNNFIGPQIFMQTPEKFPLAVAVAQLRGPYGTDYGLLMAGTVVAVMPVLLLFLLLQKEFIQGLTSGAVKG